MLKIWKVILATVVIFAAGFVTGALVFKDEKPPLQRVVRNEPAPPGPMIIQERFLERMKRELDLTPEQVTHLEKIFAESRERNRILMELIDPEIKEELRAVRERIRAELRPDQREKFEQLLRRRKQNDPNRPPGERRGTNQTHRSTNAAASTNSPTL